MADDSILKKVLKNLGQIAEETGKEALEQTGKITESVITGKELLGNITTMSDEDLARKKAEDERKNQQEQAKLLGQIHEPGRNLGAEIKQIQDEKKQEEDEKEKQFLEELRQQREAEEAERQQMSSQMGESANPAKRKKSRGSAGAHGSKKAQMPDPTQMSQTSEFKGKID